MNNLVWGAATRQLQVAGPVLFWRATEPAIVRLMPPTPAEPRELPIVYVSLRP